MSWARSRTWRPSRPRARASYRPAMSIRSRSPSTRHGPGRTRSVEAGRRPPPRALRLVQRAGAGLLAGLLVLGVLGTLGPDPSFSPAAAAGAAALGTALLPRIGWM